jgi:hypothetical protein
MTHPEDTDTVPRTVRGTIRLDHAEHAMELPADEKDDEEMMGIPKAFKVGAFPFLHGEEDYDAKSSGHYPTCDAGPGGEVGIKKSDKFCATCRCTGVSEGEFVKVDHVCGNVDEGEHNDRPGRRLVEGEVLVKGDDLVERSATKEGDKIAADGEEDEGDINM